MKKITTFALLVLSVSGFATSLRDVRASLSINPLHIGAAAERDMTTVQIYGDGEVKGYRCNADGLELPCIQKRLGSLSRKAMARLQRDIDAAALEEIIYPDPHGIHCLAIPTQGQEHSADNGSVLLRSGTFPCGFVTYRAGEAANRIVRQLNQFHGKFEAALGGHR